MLATGSRDRAIKIYDVADDFSLMHTLEGHTSWVNSVSFDNDSAHLCSGGVDKSVRLWNAKEGKLLKSIENAHKDQVRGERASCSSTRRGPLGPCDSPVGGTTE